MKEKPWAVDVLDKVLLYYNSHCECSGCVLLKKDVQELKRQIEGIFDAFPKKESL